MKLQLALDFVELDPALKIADEVKEEVDILEAGTPLIKAVGLDSVRKLKSQFSEKIINADMKTADVGDLEVKIAAEAGANIVHIMGIMPLETLKEAVAEAKNHDNVKIAVDASGIKELVGEQGLKNRVQEIEAAGADYLEVHTTISQQREGLTPFEDIRRVADFTKLSLAVAGGITVDNAQELKNIPNLEIVIVGGGITKAESPKLAAAKIKEIITNF